MSEFGKAEGEHLLASGWLQGAIFKSNDVVGVPEGIEAGTLLVVLTQSCTVVSSSLDRDPLVEVAVVTAEGKEYKPKSQEATGKVFRKLSIPLGHGENPESGIIDINRRCFIPRARFLGIKPDGPEVSSKTAKAIGGWVGRYYTRVALPNLLVAKVEDIKFTDAIKKLLERKPDGREETFHELMTVIFGKWKPDDEAGPYVFEITFVCSEGPLADDFLEVLEKRFQKKAPIVIEADLVRIVIKAQAAEEVYLNQFNDWNRLTQWDHFSALDQQLSRDS
ncbi:hypothetical protein EFD56_21240 [Rhizobium phaseoli]|uniref:hypothetical protein n=1 Tax=Rhizobium phaseoli TaxID=396 RepID=UPI000F85E499|nr:hypothetical protein [Rhizobium phaseoli]RUM16845.1 hypothetical protein EFD56_21240 [Rhizobium phaseoli]